MTGMVRTRGPLRLLVTMNRPLSVSIQQQTRNISRSRTQVWCEKKTVGYSCDQLFRVVSEVEHYHKFIPYCKKSVVTIRQPDSLSANLVIGFRPFLNLSYTSHVTMIRPHLVTAVCKDMSLFQHLHTVWKLNPIQSRPDCCEVDFAVSFKFLSAGHSYVARLVLDEVVKKKHGGIHQ
uniref:Mitochondrial coenzyme Q-binding protein COQ10 homolog A n=1 Tax=Pseudodiaptomus poplesia TaxID=213370 RepID=A0A1S6GL68_9MAXI|nr:mitochondrial coenzyme Q-binding protein COQ10 homolog A [Pseudodiaptomus poplesia]